MGLWIELQGLTELLELLPITTYHQVKILWLS
jgi:hypothetical protein